MSIYAANKAVMDLLGLPFDHPVVKIEITATPEDYPRVIVTQLLTDPADTTEARLFYLVPRNEKPCDVS